MCELKGQPLIIRSKELAELLDCDHSRIYQRIATKSLPEDLLIRFPNDSGVYFSRPRVYRWLGLIPSDPPTWNGTETESVARWIVEQGGGIWRGMQENSDVSGPEIVMWDDPVTKSTLCLLLPDLSVANVRAKMAASRQKFQGVVKQ